MFLFLTGSSIKKKILTLNLEMVRVSWKSLLLTNSN